ncbi:MAG: hypothetical protein U0Q15_12570 [Kineosporiaceae bacterium]
MMQTSDGGPRVPGVLVHHRLVHSQGIECWSGTDTGTGAAVQVLLGGPEAVQACAAATDPHELARWGAALRRIRHPHLLPVHRVVDLPGGGRAVITGHAEGPLVAEVLHGRPGWEPGAVVTLLVPLAQALAQVHRAGLVHGCPGATTIVLAEGGTPLLAGLGAALTAASLPAADALADVARLAELGLSALDGGDAGAGRPLTEVLLRHRGGAVAEGGDPGAAAEALAREVFASAVPLPIRLPSPPATPSPVVGHPEPSAPQRPAPRSPQGPAATGPVAVAAATGGVRLPVPPRSAPPGRRAAAAPTLLPAAGLDPPRIPVVTGHPAPPLRAAAWVAAVAVAGIVLGVAGWLLVGRSGAAASTPAAAKVSATAAVRASAPVSPRGATAAEGPEKAVRALAALRARALSTTDPAALAAVDVEGSPALTADQEVIAQLRATGERPVGAEPEILATSLLSWREDAAVVEVTSRVPAHRRIARSGRAIDQPAAPPTTVRLVLQPGGPEGWRVWAVEAG